MHVVDAHQQTDSTPAKQAIQSGVEGRTWAALAAIAALLKKQKPITLLLSAWWPGGRTMATPVAASCLQYMRKVSSAQGQKLHFRLGHDYLQLPPVKLEDQASIMPQSQA